MQHFDSVVDLLLCFRSLYGCMTQIHSGFSCQTDGIMFDSRTLCYTWLTHLLQAFPGPVAAKPGQIITPPPSSRLVLGVSAVMLCLVFTKHGAVHYDQRSPLRSHLYKGHCSRDPVACSLQVCKPKLCCHVHFRRKRLSSGKPFKQAVLTQSYSNCTVIKFYI